MNHQLKPRILCIDDEPAVGALLQAFFETTGDFLVKVETSAAAAIHRARMFRPDLILLDILMPALDGFALAQEIRLEPGLCHRPILFFSGKADVDAAIQKARRSGPTEFLEKGVSLGIIDQTVRRMMAERIEQRVVVKVA